MRIVLSSILLLTLVLTGCASGGSPGGQRRNPDLITSEDLRQTDLQSSTAFQAIQRMRPQWLRARAVGSLGRGSIFPKVMVDESQYREIDDLRSMSVSDIDEMRFLGPADATTRFGTGYPAGVILVSLR